MSDALRTNRTLADAMTRLGAAVALTVLAGQAFGQSTNPNDPSYDPVLAGELAQAEADRLAQLEELNQLGGGPRDGFATGGMSVAQSAGDSNGPDVAVSEYQTVDMKLVDEDLIVVLNTLAEQARVNIIASRDVNATVSANLYGVTFEEALDALLHVNGYAWEADGNFIYVMTRDEWLRREQESREKEHKVITLNYLNATDAAAFVQPLLSEVGEIVSNAAASEFSIGENRPTGAEDFALSSTLVIYDYPEHIEEIATLIESLDTRPAQVLVEATILQTSLTEANAFGVDFAIVEDINFIDFFDFGGPLGAPAALSQVFENNVGPIDNQASAVASRAGNFSGPANFRASIIAEDMAFFIRALDEVSDTTILSNPKILTLNRQPARVLVGRKLGYLNTTSTETATTQTVEFLDTGTQLSFRPFISQDEMIRLELTPRVSEGVIRESTDATGAAVTIPDEITQELTTNVLVPDGSTVVLGGLFKETTSLSRSQVPFFGDIPIVGAAFRGHDDSTDRQEIIFMIKPTIMNDRKLLSQGERGAESVERVRIGSRAGLLPWSRDKQTRNLNVEAEQAIRDGDFDEAMYNLRRSLELNPNQPEARRLREEISNEVDYWPSRSILDHVTGADEHQHAEPMSNDEVLLELGAGAVTPAAPTEAGDEPTEAIVTSVDPANPANSDTITTNDDAGVPVASVETLNDDDEVLFDEDDVFGDDGEPFADPFASADGDVEPAEADTVTTGSEPSNDREQQAQSIFDEPSDPANAMQPIAVNDPQPEPVAADQQQIDFTDPFAQYVRADRTSRILEHDPVLTGEEYEDASATHDPVLDGTHFPPQRETTQLDVAGSPESYEVGEAQPSDPNGSRRRPFGYVPEPFGDDVANADERYNVPNHTAQDNVIPLFRDAHGKLDRLLADLPGAMSPVATTGPEAPRTVELPFGTPRSIFDLPPAMRFSPFRYQMTSKGVQLQRFMTSPNPQQEFVPGVITGQGGGFPTAAKLTPIELRQQTEGDTAITSVNVSPDND